MNALHFAGSPPFVSDHLANAVNRVIPNPGDVFRVFAEKPPDYRVNLCVGHVSPAE